MKPTIRITIVLLCLVVSPALAAPSTTPPSVPLTAPKPVIDTEAKALTSVIQKQLPPGWKVTYQPEFPGIEIERLAPTAMSVIVMPSISRSWADSRPTAKPEKPQPLPHYTYFLRVVEFVDPADYQSWKLCNVETRQRMSDAVVGLRWGKGQYVTNNSEEARKAKRYQQLKESLHPLPDYYWGHISLKKIEMGGVPDYKRVIDEQVRQECTQVTQAMLNLLTPYDKPVPPTQN